MKKALTKDRIKEALELRGMKQSELVEKTGIDKGQMSSYLSGRYKPKQENLNLIANALSVDEAWLIGYDVPMERENYEDQNLLQFDYEFDEAWKIIESAGYSISIADAPDDSIVVIKDKTGKSIVYMHDYELVNKYESLRRKKIPINAKALLPNAKEKYMVDRINAFDSQLRALGWTYKIIFEADPTNKEHGVATALFTNRNLSFKASMKDCDLFIDDVESFYKERLQHLLKKSTEKMFERKSVGFNSYFEVNAANSRTDIEIPEGVDTSEDDVFDDF